MEQTIIDRACFDSAKIYLFESNYSLYYSDDENEDFGGKKGGDNKGKTKVDICNYKILLTTSGIEFYCADCGQSKSVCCFCKDKDWYSSFTKIGCTISCENLEDCKEIYKKIVDNIETIQELNRINLDMWIRENIKGNTWDLEIR